jgi:PAS domain S-box-containing protein
MSLFDMMRRLMAQSPQALGMEDMPLDPRLADMMAKFFPMPTLVLDGERDRISWASPGALLLMGISGRQLQALRPVEVLERYFSPPDALLTLYRQKARQGQYSTHFRSPEGDKFISGMWMGLPGPNGDCCQFILVFQDVTEIELLKQELLQYSEELQQQLSMAEQLTREKEQALAQLREQSERLRLLAAATAYSNMMQFILSPEGRIVWVNRTFERASGWTAQELTGKHVDEIGGSFAHLLRSPDDKPTPENSIVQHFARSPFTEEIYAYDQQGRGFWMLLTLAPITDETGIATHYFGAMLNITQRKEREERLRAFHEETTQALRYAARIQQRFMPPVEALRPYFKEVALWHAPLHGVGGDFYQAEAVEGGVVVALGDSTGHGVPAAMISVYAATTLRHALSRYKNDLEGIFRHLQEDIQALFGGNGDRPFQEGFELALLWWEPATRRAAYIGAKRPLWVWRGGEIFPVTGGSQDISATQGAPRQVATLQRLTLQPGDRLYLFSDGLTDQLSSDGKRFGSARLKSFLQTNSYLSLPEQVQLLQQALRQWAGEAPQTDDILLLAMEV